MSKDEHPVSADYTHTWISADYTHTWISADYTHTWISADYTHTWINADYTHTWIGGTNGLTHPSAERRSNFSMLDLAQWNIQYMYVVNILFSGMVHTLP
jgi:hypothetical protein